MARLGKAHTVGGRGDVSGSGAAAEDRFAGSGAQPSVPAQGQQLWPAAAWCWQGGQLQLQRGRGSPCSDLGEQGPVLPPPLEAEPGAPRPEEGRGWRCCPRVPSPRAHRRVRGGGCCACVRADRGAVCLQDGAGAAHPAAALLLSRHREKRGLGARRLLCAGT